MSAPTTTAVLAGIRESVASDEARRLSDALRRAK